MSWVSYLPWLVNDWNTSNIKQSLDQLHERLDACWCWQVWVIGNTEPFSIEDVCEGFSVWLRIGGCGQMGNSTEPFSIEDVCEGFSVWLGIGVCGQMGKSTEPFSVEDVFEGFSVPLRISGCGEMGKSRVMTSYSVMADFSQWQLS